MGDNISHGQLDVRPLVSRDEIKALCSSDGKAPGSSVKLSFLPTFGLATCGAIISEEEEVKRMPIKSDNGRNGVFCSFLVFA